MKHSFLIILFTRNYIMLEDIPTVKHYLVDIRKYLIKQTPTQVTDHAHDHAGHVCRMPIEQ